MSFYAGILLGVLTRTFVPYLVAIKKKPKIKWENYYLVAAFAGVALSLLTALILIKTINYQMDFWTAFTSAFTLNSLSRETQKALGH
jgi:branched-subunit amino acid transport protein